MKRMGRWIQEILAVCLIAVIIMNGVLLLKRVVMKEDLPSLFGFSMVTVLSGSMEPVFSPGDSLIIQRRETYEVGDIVTYADQGSFVTHRIVDAEGGSYMTKGDANNAPDGIMIGGTEIYGKVRLIIPFIGNLVLFLKSSLGIFVMIVGLLILVELPEWKRKKAVS